MFRTPIGYRRVALVPQFVVSFQDEENIAIGKGANADEGGVALGAYTTTSETYDVNINNKYSYY